MFSQTAVDWWSKIGWNCSPPWSESNAIHYTCLLDPNQNSYIRNLHMGLGTGHAYVYVSLKWDQRVMWWITNESSIRNLSTQLFQWIASIWWFSLHGPIHNSASHADAFRIEKRIETKKWRQKYKNQFSLYVMQHHRLVPKYNLSAFFPCLLSIQIAFTSNINDRSINYYP